MHDIPSTILQRLRCPRCGEPLADQRLACRRGHEFRRREGYLDALSGDEPSLDPQTDRTLASFGYEWTSFDRIQPEDEGFFHEYFEDVDLESLRGRVGVDVGCGKGRYTRFMADYLAAVVALDGSDAVRSTARNLADLSNSVVLRGDLRTPPLADESFGFVSCLGVLHHLADPKGGFDSLVRLLAPDGILVVYLYSRPTERNLRSVALRAATELRRVTVRLPHPLVRLLSAPISAVLYVGVVIPGSLGARTGRMGLADLPLAPYRGQPMRSLWLDTFDRLSAPLEKRFVWGEVKPWFEGAGLEVKGVSHRHGLTIVARRPPV